MLPGVEDLREVHTLGFFTCGIRGCGVALDGDNFKIRGIGDLYPKIKETKEGAKPVDSSFERRKLSM